MFSLDYGEVVDSKDTIKDLQIMVDKEFTYKDYLRKAVSKTKQKSAWRSVIQCHLDYSIILWAPYSLKYKLKLL